ncbi:MAG: aldo/keto reductase [Pseudomonadota bacterium]|nr:aldo/keto reductase [Pseudomonadota bacterium]
MRRTIGSSGLSVAPIGLGGMPMSIQGRPPEAEALRTIHAALDAGMDFIDTADVYCKDDTDIGHNERLIAKALRDRADGRSVVVATKGGLERPKGDWTTNGRPEHLRSACDRSLAALGVDQIQLYQLHAPDDDVPFADSVGALAELRAAGKIAHVGLSNVSVAEIEAARAIVPIVSVQNRCNPFDRSAWTDGVVQYCTANGLAFLPYSPVGGGRGKAKVATDKTLVAVGQRHGVSPFQVTLAWLLAKSPVMLPIPGASKVASAVDSAAAMKLVLTAEDLAELDRAFPT